MKLLTYSLKKYCLLSLLLIAVSIPALYIFISIALTNLADQTLTNKIAYTLNQLKEVQTPDDLALWKKLDKSIDITLFNKNNFNQQPFTKAILNSESNEFETFRCAQKKVNIFGINHTLTFTTPFIESKFLLQSILMVTLPLMLLVFIGFFVLDKTLHHVWKPFYQITNFLKTYEPSGNPQLTEEELEIDEFNELKFAVKHLTEKSAVNYQLQKEFTENAAHELQTPVAIIKSKLDLMLQEKGLSNNQSLLIDQIYYVLQKLSDLNKNLLFLSKIENQQFSLDDNIDCVASVSVSVNSLKFFAEGKYQQLLFKRQENVFLRGNQLLFEQMLINLLMNAIQYAPKGSIVSVTLSDESLVIVNEGPQLSFSENKLFSRFSKTTEKEQIGNGLGLAICKKIAEVHGFDIVYSYANSKHYFCLNFKQKSED